MVSKMIKPVAVVAVGMVLIGFFLFGNGFFSYLRTGSRAVQRAAQDSVSIEFELQRARDMVDDILPQLQANVRLIAEDEVEIAALEKDIAENKVNLEEQAQQLAELRNKMDVHQVSYRIDNHDVSRDRLTDLLAQEFTQFRDAQLILDGKEKLLETRRQSLQNALQMHDRAKHQKIQLEQKIESLIAQHRLVQSSSIGSKVAMDDSQLTRADQLLAQIQRRLDVSQRILAHETDLHEIQLDSGELNESDLLSEFDEYFDGDSLGSEKTSSDKTLVTTR